MTFTQARKELDALGYTLVKDNREGITFHTYPKGSGSTGYFRTLAEVETYIENVKEIRACYE